MADIRTQIGSQVARAITSSKDSPEDQRYWVALTTDNIIKTILKFMPEPIDIESKYEVGSGEGVYVTVGPEQAEHQNERQLQYLARFADDQGYNRYRHDMGIILSAPYLAALQSSDTIRGEGDNNGNTYPNQPTSKRPG